MNHFLVAIRLKGFHMLDRLVDDYRNARNQFDQLGVCLFGVFDTSGTIFAIGGLNQDPYSPELSVGRLRRFYILSAYRRQGTGKRLHFIRHVVFKSHNPIRRNKQRLTMSRCLFILSPQLDRIRDLDVASFNQSNYFHCLSTD